MIIIIVSALSIVYPALGQTTSPKDLAYITEQFPPYNFEKDVRLQGISVDLLNMVWERMGVNLNTSSIKLLPWTEGYQRALSEPNTVLFSTARLPQREQLFKWAGPIGPIRNVLLANRNSSISIAGAEDLRKYRIGAIKDDSAAQMLLDKGAEREDLVLETDPGSVIEMLQSGSIDAWAYGDAAALWLIQESGANVSDFKVVYVLGEIDYYYAFNKETPDSVVQSFQSALDYVKNKKDEAGVNAYQRILSKYVPVML